MAKNLIKTINTYFKLNKKIQNKICPKGKTNLLIQPFFESKCGGVIFSQWKYFTNHFFGEISKDGAQDTVDGINTSPFLSHKYDSEKDLISSKNLPIESIRKTLKQCENIFNFPLDIEWAFDGKNIMILQIRPITRPIQSLQKANKIQTTKEERYLQKIAPGNWCINEFSESFGIISPLSFDVIQYCFNSNLTLFQNLGFKAEYFNFLAYCRNGQIYANPDKQAKFFMARSFTTPFWQVINEKKYKDKITNFSQKIAIKSDFDKILLSKIFGYWNIANFYAMKDQNISCRIWTNEYEALQLLHVDIPQTSQEMSWLDWRNFYKQWWLYEYEKLKKIVKKNPLMVFGKLENIFTINQERLQKNYETSLPYSILSFPYNFKRNDYTDKSTCVVKTKPITAPVIIIKHPESFDKNFPKNHILVAPYFNNDWILSIEKFKGIILENGGSLSHSAIVAREKNIPYFIHWNEATKIFKNGEITTIG